MELTIQIYSGIITPPSVTMQLLREAKDAGISAVWLQPGSFDSEGLRLAQSEFKAVVAGLEGNPRGHEGWCGMCLSLL